MAWVEGESKPAVDGWNYERAPGEGDARKFVTLEQDGMTWVGIRAWHHQGRYWVNNGEPERANVIAWRDLPEPAQGWWTRGKLHVPSPISLKSDEATLREIESEAEKSAVEVLAAKPMFFR